MIGKLLGGGVQGHRRRRVPKKALEKTSNSQRRTWKKKGLKSRNRDQEQGVYTTELLATRGQRDLRREDTLEPPGKSDLGTGSN